MRSRRYQIVRCDMRAGLVDLNHIALTWTVWAPLIVVGYYCVVRTLILLRSMYWECSVRANIPYCMYVLLHARQPSPCPRASAATRAERAGQDHSPIDRKLQRRPDGPCYCSTLSDGLLLGRSSVHRPLDLPVYCNRDLWLPESRLWASVYCSWHLLSPRSCTILGLTRSFLSRDGIAVATRLSFQMPDDNMPTARAAALSPSPPVSSSSPLSLFGDFRPPWSRVGSGERRSSTLPSTREVVTLRDQLINYTSGLLPRLQETWRKMNVWQRAGAVIAVIALLGLGVGFMILTGHLFKWLRPLAEKWEHSTLAVFVLWLSIFFVSFPPMVGWTTLGTICGFAFGWWKGYGALILLRSGEAVC